MKVNYKYLIITQYKAELVFIFYLPENLNTRVNLYNSYYQCSGRNLTELIVILMLKMLQINLNN